MALPVTISGVTYPRANSFLGPYKSSGGNFYFVAFDTTSSKVAVYKATDPTSSFTEQDSANRPATLGLSTLANTFLTIVQDSDILRMAQSDGDFDAFYHDFNMGTDTWATKDKLILTNTVISGSIIVRSDASLIILLNSAKESIHGATYNRVSYVKSTDAGVTWTSPTAVGATGVQRHIWGSQAIKGASDRAHFFYSDDSTAKHRSLSSADALGSEETPTSANAVLAGGDTTPVHNFIHGVSYVSGANTVIKTAYRASGSDKLDDIVFNSAATGAAVGTAAFTDNTIFDNGTTAPSSVHGCFALDGTTVHCLYSDHTTQDLFYTKEADGGSWDADTEELDAVTINAISANVYDRSGTKLSYIYDDGGTVKYNEKALGGAGDSPRTPTVGSGVLTGVAFPMDFGILTQVEV